MRAWLTRGGLLGLLVPLCAGCATAYESRPLYAAHPGYHGPYYAAPGYYYAPPPRSYYSFGFVSGHGHGHHHRGHRSHRHHW